jgi:hypothetical protein
LTADSKAKSKNSPTLFHLSIFLASGQAELSRAVIPVGRQKAPNLDTAELERIRHFTLESRSGPGLTTFLCCWRRVVLKKSYRKWLVTALCQPCLPLLSGRPTLQVSLAHFSQKLKISLWPALLALAISACASSPAEHHAAQIQRDKIAADFDLTADGWQTLGVNEEQQQHYRKLAEEARKGQASKELAPDSLLNRLLRAVLGAPPGAARMPVPE